MDTNSVTSHHQLPLTMSSARTQRKVYEPLIHNPRAHSSLRGQESGFRSTASLSSLPMSAYDPRPGPCLLGMAPSDSLASLTSGISSFHLPCPAPCSPLPSCQGRRHSLTRLSGRLTGSRVSLSRRSARHLLPTKESSLQLAQFRPAQ